MAIELLLKQKSKMPIKVEDYVWTQTDDEVSTRCVCVGVLNSSKIVIELPLRGVKAKTADIYTNDAYIKVSW